jgi:hypothetical protein
MNKILSSAETESILSSIVKVEHHYHKELRREGLRFKTEKTWVENGPPEEKKGFGMRNRFGGKSRGGNKPYDGNRGRSHQRFEDEEDLFRLGAFGDNHDDMYGRSSSSKSKSKYNGGYKREPVGGYRAEPYSKYKKFDQSLDNNEREYQRHKKNNNSHLAEHYRNKAERSRR